ncbi:MAG: hypothetical protein M1820_001796 [Bogoriella megaspora]|nr:MAG: hypothetical protein M1820_001796 [Bogoriella megaspora]
MAAVHRKRIVFFAVSLLVCLYYLHGGSIWSLFQDEYEGSTVPIATPTDKKRIDWSNLTQRYPVPTQSMIPLPTGKPAQIPTIQHNFSKESRSERKAREARRKAVYESFLHSYKGYQKHAWLQDEVSPLSGGYKNGFGGWGATLIDTLDTLWIMGLKKEFAVACAAIEKINFTAADNHVLSVFETTIRYVGGLLGAYDLSRGKYPVLLKKAVELGDMIYAAFDTPNRMPITYWEWEKTAAGDEQEAGTNIPIADIGSLSMEFTRLSQLTGDPKYYDAIQRIYNAIDAQQDETRLPGMWPLMVNARSMNFSQDGTFTFGAMSDSLYEYFPKQHLLLGGVTGQMQKMYEGTIRAAKKYIFFRPMSPQNADVLIAGTVRDVGTSSERLDPEGQHLTCFVGGMVGIAAKIFDRPAEEMEIARKLTDACIWSYETMPTGIGPEIFRTVPCSETEKCEWDETRWLKWIAHDQYIDAEKENQLELARDHVEETSLIKGFTEIRERKYILRPEAIESIFIMYRITGDKTLQDQAWKMFQAVEKYTRTDVAHSALKDVTVVPPEQVDSMESFWTAETLKYYYLIFSEPDLISLDEYVL